MKEIFLKSSEVMIIREATLADAQNMIAFAKKVGDETNFLTFSGAEFNKTLEQEQKIIFDHLEAKNQIFLLAEIDGELAAMSNVMASSKNRLKHIGDFGISVLKAHWNKGIGSELIAYTFDWAKSTGLIRKLNLRVLEQNTSAIGLYKKMGFEIEGKLTRDGYIDGVFSDSILMGILID